MRSKRGWVTIGGVLLLALLALGGSLRSEGSEGDQRSGGGGPTTGGGQQHWSELP